MRRRRAVEELASSIGFGIGFARHSVVASAKALVFEQIYALGVVVALLSWLTAFFCEEANQTYYRVHTFSIANPPPQSVISVPLFVISYVYFRFVRGKRAAAAKVWSTACCVLPMLNIVAATYRPLEVLAVELELHVQFRATAGSCMFALGVMHASEPLKRFAFCLTAAAVIGGYAIGCFVSWLRSGDERWTVFSLVLLAPYAFSLALARSLRSMRLGAARRHGATPLSVDSTCCVCNELLATNILLPCRLGACPECFCFIMTFSKRCPQCGDRVSHSAAIRHCDMDGDEIGV